MSKTPSILIVGAAGYVGSRFRRALDIQKIPAHVLAPGDMLNAPFLRKALQGCHTAFYLENAEYESAKNFAHACSVNKVQKIIYLGKLGASAGGNSPHLRRRQKVGEILLASGVSVVEFRASIIIGSGSFSFEIIRALVERLPVMIAPHWVRTQAQPIAIDDVIAYLLEVIHYRGPSRVFEIGGPERVPFGELIRECSRQRRVRRWMISIPVLAPRLSSFCLSRFLALDTRAVRALIESLCVSTVVSHPEALRIFRVRPRSYDQAIALALQGTLDNL